MSLDKKLLGISLALFLLSIVTFMIFIKSFNSGNAILWIPNLILFFVSGIVASGLLVALGD